MDRAGNDDTVAKNIAVAGMAALLIAGHPQMAMAKDVALQGQVQIRDQENAFNFPQRRVVRYLEKWAGVKSGAETDSACDRGTS